VSLERLCRLFGFTRQGLWRQGRSTQVEEMDCAAMVGLVKEIRSEMPRCGVRKLKVLLAGMGHDIGRDRLFAMLSEEGLLLKRTHHRTITTYSRHWMKKWPNLVRDIVPTEPDQEWVSDITYVDVHERDKHRFMYLSLITDAYTHEIVGYALHDTLDTEGPLRALSMAIASRPSGALKGLIHHSDRGCQYCSHEYVSRLKACGMRISMTEKGDPYENAIAERVNGILKTEWLYQMRLTSIRMAEREIDRIIWLYNNKRPHSSIGNMTPVQARLSVVTPPKLWKNYYAIKKGLGQQPAGEESHYTELPAAVPSCSRRKSYTAAAVPV